MVSCCVFPLVAKTLLDCIFYRVAWTLVLLAAFAGFLYLLVIKVQQLLDYPTNINVKFNFLDTLAFPAVTICNINPYRSAACLTFYSRTLSPVYVELRV